MPRKSEFDASPASPSWSALPGLTGLDRLMAMEPGHEDILVAIVDGPVHGAHPDLAGARLGGPPADTLPAAPLAAPLGDAPPRSDHGTHIASVVLGRSAGIARGCRGIVIPVYGEDAAGRLVDCGQADLAMAIDRALDAGAHVINISGGVKSESGRAEFLLESAIERCVRANVLVVAAAGNDGCDCVHVPAALPGVLAVGAADADGLPLGFSNFGEGLRGQGILAPGAGIPGAAPPDGTVAKTGTSFATPIVTAVAALLLSLQRRNGETPDPLGVRKILLDCAVGALPDEDFAPDRALRGRLNVPCAHRRVLGADGDPAAPSPTLHPEKDQSMPNTPTLPAPVAPSDFGHADLSDLADAAVSHSEAAIAPSALARPAPAAAPAASVAPSDCGCRRAAPSAVASGQLVFALGQLSYDFGTEARMDYFIQQMGGAADIMNPVKMATRLQSVKEGGEGHTDEAEALIWTLNIDDTPVYALEPDSQFAVLCYLRLVEFLFQQEKQGVERISIAGKVRGTTRLYNGTVVPSISPTLRGMYNWNVQTLVDAVLATMDKMQPEEEQKVRARIGEFLHRVYYEMRNPGLTAQNRAMNFAATNAFHSGPIFKEMAGQSMVLDRITVERSPICRPDSDCWDVVISFFNPARIMDQARKVYRITVDVSDVVPVTVGDARSWHVYFNGQ